MPVRYGTTEVRVFLEDLNNKPANELENQWLEFEEWPKDGRDDIEDVIEQKRRVLSLAVCFANAQGGTVVFGVKDGVIGMLQACEGIETRPDLLESLEKHLSESTNPKIVSRFEFLPVEGLDNQLLLMHVDATETCSSDEATSFRIDKACLPIGRAVESLLAILKGENNREANDAVKDIARIGKSSMPLLIEQWLSDYIGRGDNDDITRIENIWTKMKGNPEVEEYVVGHLQNESDQRLRALIAAAARIAPEQALERIGQILLKPNHTAEVRDQAARSLAREMKGAEVSALLNASLLREENEGVLKAILEEMRNSRWFDDSSVKGLLELIKHRKSQMRALAAEGLGSTGFDDASVIEALREATSDRQLEVAIASIVSLKKIGGAEVMKILDEVSILTSSVEKAASEAVNYLRQRAAAKHTYKYDVFLSYKNSDTSVVEMLANRLRTNKLRPFVDRSVLIAGESWQEKLAAAVNDSATFAAFCSPPTDTKVLGDWQDKELELALIRNAHDETFRVFPVLLPGFDTADMPAFLRSKTWVDFRSGPGDDQAFRSLLTGIRGVTPEH